MIPDVATGDPTKMLCLRCARKIVSPKSAGKYNALASYLRFRAAFTDVVKLSFAKIDGIIGDNLPISAYRDQRWWNKSPDSTHARAWLDAGWKSQEVNLEEGYVVFQKVGRTQTVSRRRKASRSEAKKPFTPVHVRIPRTKKPSKTKVAKLYGRLKNLERKRASMPKYRGSFRSKPKHEKKLFRLEERPQ